MADPTKLTPGEACRLLNSTPLGEVIHSRKMYEHRQLGGVRVGNAKTVNLFGYVGWLVHRRHSTPAKKTTDELYAERKDSARARNAAIAKAGRDIGELPAVVNPERLARAERDFQFYCESYYPTLFALAWSDDHLKVIVQIERAVLEGGLFAMAMPRAQGKTTLCECAATWASLCGHRSFTCLIGSDEGSATEMLDSIKRELETNDLLLEDFPAACYPIRCLEGIANRCSGQLYQGDRDTPQRTHIGWTAKEIVLPTIPGAPSSAAIIKATGITGRVRGMKFKRPDGRSVRPELVILDDPQTDESARSVSQCATRENLVAGAVLGLAGPGNKIAGVMPCTVIRPGDMADNILNRAKHPEWNGIRTRMVYDWPTATPLWDEYAKLRAEGLRQGDEGAAATEYYRTNQGAMDAGSRVAWPHRKNYDEVSALQHAVNLKLRDEAAFAAEYQNEPLLPIADDDDLMSADDIAMKTNGIQQQEVPIDCETITTFIDVQKSMLFFATIAWRSDFTGYVIDYGGYPDQHKPYFTLRTIQHTLADVAPKGAGFEGQLYAGLEELVGQLAGPYVRDDGAEMMADRILIDANWGDSTDLVYEFCRQSSSSIVMPSHGRYIGASSKPMSDYRKKPGERVGLNWMIPNVRGKRSVRHVLFDTNFWKSFIQKRLLTAQGDAGCLSLFEALPHEHRMFGEQLTAEFRVRTTGRGRTVDEWKLRPDRVDNHLLDCVAGAAVAASLEGISIAGHATSSNDTGNTASQWESFFNDT